MSLKAQLQHDSDLFNMNELEVVLTKAMLDTVENDLDWTGYLDVAGYIMGDTEQVQELRRLVNEVHGLEIVAGVERSGMK